MKMSEAIRKDIDKIRPLVEFIKPLLHIILSVILIGFNMIIGFSYFITIFLIYTFLVDKKKESRENFFYIIAGMLFFVTLMILPAIFNNFS